MSWRKERRKREIELEGTSVKMTQDGTCIKNKMKQLQITNVELPLQWQAKMQRRTVIPLTPASKNDEHERNIIQINEGQADKSTD